MTARKRLVLGREFHGAAAFAQFRLCRSLSLFFSFFPSGVDACTCARFCICFSHSNQQISHSKLVWNISFTLYEGVTQVVFCTLIYERRNEKIGCERFSAIQNASLFIRWMQNLCLSPVLHVHCPILAAGREARTSCRVRMTRRDVTGCLEGIKNGGSIVQKVRYPCSACAS